MTPISKMEHLRIVVQLNPQICDMTSLDYWLNSASGNNNDSTTTNDNSINNNNTNNFNNTNNNNSTTTKGNDNSSTNNDNITNNSINNNNKDSTPTTTNNKSITTDDSNIDKKLHPYSPSDKIDSDAFQNTLPVIVHMIDSMTLQLQIENEPHTPTQRLMQFDFVGQAVAAQCLKMEMSHLMDKLLLERRNCCLVRFAPSRDFHRKLVHNLLVTEVNKRLVRIKARVHFIKVEYRDIVRDGVRDLLHSGEPDLKSPIVLNRLLQSGDDDNDDFQSPVVLGRLLQSISRTGGINKLGGGVNDHFNSTRGLLLWLLNDCRLKGSTTQGHEQLVFNFFIVGAQQQMFKVKFTLFNVYVSRMDDEARCNWGKYMDWLGGWCGTAFVHSPLTKCLSEHFEVEDNSGPTLLMFDVPTSMKGYCTLDAYNLLKMADGVVKNRQLDHNIFMRLRKLKLVDKTPEKVSAASNACGAAELAQTTPPMNMIAATPSSVCFTIPIETDKEIKRRRMSNNFCTKKDLSTLSKWHRKIDVLFRTTRDLMKQFYARRFDASIVQMCSNVKAMARCIDHENQTLELETTGINDNIAEKYKAAFDTFLQFSEEIEKSYFADILKIYYEVKRFELTQHALKLKIKNLVSHRQLLTSTIDEEVCGLSGMLFRETEEDH